MTRHRIANLALTGALFLSMAAVLLGGPVLDDNSDEWAQSSALADAQKAAQLEARTERAAHHVTGCAIDSVERMEGGAA